VDASKNQNLLFVLILVYKIIHLVLHLVVDDDDVDDYVLVVVHELVELMV
jgi:hypothetical protein